MQTVEAISPTSITRITRLPAGLILLLLATPWCASCRLQESILACISRRLSDRICILDVNIDCHPDAAQRFSVDQIPTMILFAEGREVRRFVGLHSERQILSAMRRDEAMRRRTAGSIRQSL